MSTVDRLFSEALDLEPSERETFLARAAAERPDLVSRLRRLLESDNAAERELFLQANALQCEANAAQAEAARVDRRFGSYRSVRLIGSGGMGVVYQATRDDREFDKTVAIKVLHWGLENDDVRRRLVRERQTLARLEHPAIVRLLDGGSTAEGLPYIVMEYVEGASITEFAAARSLPPRERLELFREVCGAVEYAHANLLLHRDLKPANILVTSQGRPKLLDFGIAALMDARGDHDLTLGNAAFTPAYASPEQIAGGTLTVTTDVYSLGVVLYELLNGVRWERNSARQKSGRGDLDNIVSMALRNDPTQRYNGVNQLSADLKNYLDGMPVLATGNARWYLATKFVRRRRRPLIAAIALVASAGAGYLATVRQKNRAERRLINARLMAQSVLVDLHDKVAQLPGATPLRRDLVERIKNELESLAQEEPGDESLKLELAVANKKLGDVQGMPYASNLGDSAGAMLSYRRAERLLLSLRPETNLPVAQNLMGAYSSLEMLLLRLGRRDEALNLANGTTALAKRFEGKPERAAALIVANQHWLFGVALFNSFRRERWLADTRNAVSEFRKQADALKRGGLSPKRADQFIGYVLWRQGLLEKNVGAYREALALHRQNLERAVAAGERGRGLGSLHSDLARSLARCGAWKEAMSNFGLALSEVEQTHRRDSTNRESALELAALYRDMAETELRAGDPRKSIEWSARAFPLFEQALKDDPENSEAATGLVLAREVAAEAARASGQELLGYQLRVEQLRAAKQLAVLSESQSATPDGFCRTLVGFEMNTRIAAERMHWTAPTDAGLATIHRRVEACYK